MKRKIQQHIRRLLKPQPARNSKPSDIGHDAETLACEYLVSHGLTFLARNQRYKVGELDLIMREGETIIFVEVRSRHNQHYASALESIDASKIKKIARAAACYLQQRQWTYTRLARFDVVALERQQIHWIKDAFQLDTF